MMILHDAGIDQGGVGAAEGASQQLPVLREAAGFAMMILQDAGTDQGGWSVADGPSHQLAVLLRREEGRGEKGDRKGENKVDGVQPMASPSVGST